MCRKIWSSRNCLAVLANVGKSDFFASTLSGSSISRRTRSEKIGREFTSNSTAPEGDVRPRRGPVVGAVAGAGAVAALNAGARDVADVAGRCRGRRPGAAGTGARATAAAGCVPAGPASEGLWPAAACRPTRPAGGRYCARRGRCPPPVPWIDAPGAAAGGGRCRTSAPPAGRPDCRRPTPTCWRQTSPTSTVAPPAQSEQPASSPAAVRVVDAASAAFHVIRSMFAPRSPARWLSDGPDYTE